MFKCAHCSYETPKVESLTDHVKKSHEATNKPSKTFQCKFCPFNSDKYLSLMQHREAKHKNSEATGKTQDASKGKTQETPSSSQATGKRILVCKYCSIFQTCDNDELLMHFKSKHSNEKNTKNQSQSNTPAGILPCSICSGPGYKGLLAKTNCCTTVLFKCGICSSSFKTREAMLEHLSASHASDVKCSRCSATFTTANALIQHATAKHGSLKASLIHCILCHQMNDEDRILQHVLDKHCYRKLGYVCGLCDFYKANFSAVTDHIKNQHSQDMALCKHSVSTVQVPEKPSSPAVPKGLCCSMCEKVFSAQNLLEEHFLNTHFSNTENNVLCFICGAPAKNYSLLKVHSKDSHNVDKVICECFFCNPIPGSKKLCYVSKDTQDLFKHFLEEHDLSLNCTICKNLTDQNLTAATKALKIKPAVNNTNNCILCKFIGKSAESLVHHHMETHSKKSTFQQCIFPNCGATFDNLNSALMHVIVDQHGRDSSALKVTENKYSCIIDKCTFSYSDRVKFRDHLLKNHAKDISCSSCTKGKCALHP